MMPPFGWDNVDHPCSNIGQTEFVSVFFVMIIIYSGWWVEYYN